MLSTAWSQALGYLAPAVLRLQQEAGLTRVLGLLRPMLQRQPHMTRLEELQV